MVDTSPYYYRRQNCTARQKGMIVRKKLLILATLLSAGPACGSVTTGALDDLFMYATSLIDTRYHSGGASPDTGLDCSGFVRHVYLQTTHLELPRTAADMSHTGQPVDQTKLLPGDLVFFNTRQRPFSHVGIYLGENRFIHASSSTTGRVVISDILDRYWASRYAGARRIFDAFSASSQP
jgi:cell wall-associated NlpC family hydrolase